MIPKEYIIGFISVLVIIGGIYYAYSNNLITPTNSSATTLNNSSTTPQNNSIVVLKCNDGTSINSCSSNASYYCNSNRQLVFNCDSCGCPDGLVCSGSACIDTVTPLLSRIDQSLVYIQTSYSNGSGVITAHKDGQTIVTTARSVVRYAINLTDVNVTFVSPNGNITNNPFKILIDENSGLAFLYVNGLIGTPAQKSNFSLGQDVLAVGSSINGEGRVSSGTISSINNGNVQVTAPVNPQINGGGIFTQPNGSLIGIAIIDPSFEGENPIASIPQEPNETEWQPQMPACDCHVCDCG